ncbi:MAG TPA: phage holin family protein [Xanthobacteraceae bacterium]|jgi:hypothetical protein
MTQVGALLEAAMALKVRQLQLAARSYVDDRATQSKSAIASYVLAASFFIAAVIFVCAACLVGAIALYRWIALQYGQFVGFACIGGLLLLLAIVCAGIAMVRLKTPTPKVTSLSSRLVTAAKANPARFNKIPHATAGNLDPASTRRVAQSSPDRRGQHRSDGRWLLLGAVTLLSWTIARNRHRIGR